MIKFRALMEAIHGSIQEAAQAQEKFELDATMEDYFEVVDAQGKVLKNPDEKTLRRSDVRYRAKMVSMDFPVQSAQGLTKKTVEVPLITLSPVCSSQISEVKFSTELEITSDKKGTLHVDFPKQSSRGLLKPRRSNTKIEICLTGRENPDGLSHIIDGYEKILRSQIPA